ncbi:MAG: hypothetical protein WAM66_07570, partial [Acidobacteriaceae bacterium]
LNDKLASFNQWSATSLKTFHGMQGKSGRYDPSANIALIEGANLAINDRFGNLQAKKDDDAASARQKQLEDQRSSAQKAKEALDKLTASVKQAADAIQRNQTNMREASLGGLLMPKAMVGMYGQPSSSLQSMQPKSDLSRVSEYMERIKTQGHDQAQWLTNLNQYTSIQQQNADAMARASLQMEVATGRISAHDAAVKLASIHTEEYSQQIDALWSQLDKLKSMRDSGAISAAEYKEKFSNIQNQMMGINGQRAVRFSLDNAKINDSTFSRASREALDRMVQSWTDMTAQFAEILPRSIERVNSTLSRSLMAHAYNGQEYRRGIEQGLGNAARGVGSQVLNAGFHQIEGSVLGKLGFGPQAKLGESESNAMWVRMADGRLAGVPAMRSLLGAASLPGPLPALPSILASASGLLPDGLDLGGSNSGSVAISTPGKSGVGGATTSIVASLLKFLPHFADGGPIPSNLPAVVGERGPELFIPSSSGQIVPNHQLGGTTHNHYMPINVDARGAHDPAAVEAAVNRGILQAAPSLVRASVHAVHEGNRRVAPSQRR